VVVGYANKVATEVHQGFCGVNTIPILRRCTGGGTVLQGPGVFNYALILRMTEAGPLGTISATNDFILQRLSAALGASLKAPVASCGQTDLAIGGLKFCGNAQRRKKSFLIFHGSFLLHLDLDFLEKILPLPSKQPDYRFSRSHSDFLMNLKVPSSVLKESLRKAWKASAPLAEIPYQRIASLARDKYRLDEWNLKF
jgi:lipoate-protein ligase A